MNEADVTATVITTARGSIEWGDPDGARLLEICRSGRVQAVSRYSSSSAIVWRYWSRCAFPQAVKSSKGRRTSDGETGTASGCFPACDQSSRQGIAQLSLHSARPCTSIVRSVVSLNLADGVRRASRRAPLCRCGRPSNRDSGRVRRGPGQLSCVVHSQDAGTLARWWPRGRYTQGIPASASVYMKVNERQLLSSDGVCS